jgi:hypothetical protein
MPSAPTDNRADEVLVEASAGVQIDQGDAAEVAPGPAAQVRRRLGQHDLAHHHRFGGSILASAYTLEHQPVDARFPDIAGRAKEMRDMRVHPRFEEAVLDATR